MATTMPSAFDRRNKGGIRTNVSAGNNSVKMTLNNSARNNNNIANMGGNSRGGGKTVIFPVAIPPRQNAPPPPPQLFMPVPIAPGPITYPLSGFESPGDVQTILNQPGAVILGENNVAAGYVPPPYVTQPPSFQPAVGGISAIPSFVPSLMPALQVAAAVPWYMRFDIIIPTVLGLLILSMVLHLWWQARPDGNNNNNNRNNSNNRNYGGSNNNRYNSAR